MFLLQRSFKLGHLLNEVTYCYMAVVFGMKIVLGLWKANLIATQSCHPFFILHVCPFEMKTGWKYLRLVMVKTVVRVKVQVQFFLLVKMNVVDSKDVRWWAMNVKIWFDTCLLFFLFSFIFSFHAREKMAMWHSSNFHLVSFQPSVNDHAWKNVLDVQNYM